MKFLRINKMIPSQLETRMIRLSLIFCLALSVTNIVLNVILDYPFSASVKWLILIALVIIACLLLRHDQIQYVYPYISILVPLVVIFVILPMGWYSLDGHHGYLDLYVTIFMVLLALTIRGKRRWVFGILTIVEYDIFVLYDSLYRPAVYENISTSYYLEKMVQMPLVLIIMLIGISSVVKMYTQQHQQIVTLSNTDSLTGVHNRRSIIQIIEGRMSDVRDQQLHLILFDIDDFKDINDQFGHQAGDRVLINICEGIQRLLPPGSEIGRFGGDEFIILLHPATQLQAQAFCNQLIDKITHQSFGPVECTVSGGLVSIQPALTLNDMIYRADILLYEAKPHGKNVILWQGKNKNKTH